MLSSDAGCAERPIPAVRTVTSVDLMSDAARKTTHDRALEAVRGYANHDAVAVGDALTGLEDDRWIEVYAVLSGLLRSTISIMELTGERWKLCHLVRYVDEVSAAAPPHYEFAIAAAARAWADGDESALLAMARHDLVGAVHMTAVFVVVAGHALWGASGFHAVLREFQETAAELVEDPASGI